MWNRKLDPRGYAMAACSVVLLLGAAQSAHANPHYDSSSLNGNLQHQCTAFNATLVSGTSLTVSAECNAEGEVQGEVQHVRRSNSFDISGEVVWNTETEAFTWDATTDDNNDITVKCTAVRGYSISASDVTLQLTCTGTSTDGSVKSVNADLPLNDNLIAGILGYIERR